MHQPVLDTGCRNDTVVKLILESRSLALADILSSCPGFHAEAATAAIQEAQCLDLKNTGFTKEWLIWAMQ